MAQHDYIISNQGFPATRTDINNVLNSIATLNSGTSAPSTQYAGQMWINTTTATNWILYIYDGADNIQIATINTSTNTINFTDSALSVITDLAPQLGGNLDVNGYKIVSASNANVEIEPNGTGDVYLSADTVRLGDSNATATVTTNGTGDLVLNTNSGTNSGSITITQGANANITVAPNGTGDVNLDADTLRVGDSNANATITTNGTGNLTINTNAGTNSGSILINQGANGNIELTPNGTGDVYVSADTLRVGDSNADATITSNGTGDLILNTNSGTTSGSITIADGANGNITVANNGTGQIVVNAGAVGTPVIAPTGDSNTGIFFPSADTIAFTKGGAEAMRIDSSGDVGIGTTAGFTSGNGLEIQRAGVATLRCDNSTSTAAGEFRADATGTAIDCRGLEVFRTLTGGTERMRIDSSGRVGIGTTAPAYTVTVGDTDAGRGWSVNLNNNVGNVRSRASASDQQTHNVFLNTNGEVGSIKTNGSATAFNTSSDYRLKENVNYNFDATTRLKQLKPARFNFKADSTTTFDGFIAHEVKEVIPEAISGEKDAVDEKGNISPQGIDQSKLVPLLTKALQEAIIKIEQLEARLTALESK